MDTIGFWFILAYPSIPKVACFIESKSCGFSISKGSILANRLLKAMVTGSLSSQRIIWKPTKISFGGNYLLACTDRHWLYIYICSLYLLPSLQFAQLTYLRNMIGSTGIWTKLAQCNHKLLAREFLIDDVGLQAKCFHAVLFVEWISNSDCVCFVSRSISIEKNVAQIIQVYLSNTIQVRVWL